MNRARRPSRGGAEVLLALAAAGLLTGCPSRPAARPASPSEAVAAARESLAEARRSSGGESIEAARALDALVEALYRAGQATAEETTKCAEDSLEIRRKALPPEHPELATSLNNLGAVLHARGDYGRARSLYEEALAIRRKSLAAAPPAGGPSPPDSKDELVDVLNNLAEAERRMGDIAAAKSRFREAIEILEGGPAGGRRGRSLVMLRANLGLLLHDAGDLEEARASMEKARESWEGDPESRRDLARVSNNLGRLLHDLGSFPQARESFERALAIHRSLDAPSLPEMADALNNLGYLYHAAGERARAEPLYREALALREKALGKGHPSVAWTLTNLGLLSLEAGDLPAARPLLERAAEIRRDAFGDDHWLSGHSRTYLACLHLLSGDAARALEESLRAEEVRREALLLSIPVLAERQALGMASLDVFGLSASSLDMALSIASPGDAPGAGPGSIREVWDALMRSRGVVLDEMARRLRAGAGGSAAGKLREDLARARQELANLWVRGALRQSGESYRDLLREARRRVEESEAALGLSSAPSRSRGEITPLGFDSTRAALSAGPAGSALLAFARYQKVEPPREGRLRPVPSYLAFLLSGAGGPRAFDLGPARVIDGLVESWRREVLQGAAGGGAGGGVLREAGEALRKRVWDPIAGDLAGARRVYIVPDGSLNLVSFAGLPVPEGRALLETGPSIHYLSAEKDLVLFPTGPPPGRREGGLLVLGDPDFGAPEARPSDGGAPGIRDALPPFERLPGTGKEMEEVSRIFRRGTPGTGEGGVTELAGEKASESSFKRLARGKRVLHLATHGFCLEGGPAPAGPGAAGRRGVGEPEAVGEDPAPPEGFENPLLLSGLALAGANRRGGASPDDDGILTGEEIAALDLSGVEWAVLSACKTGVGKIRRGEGVLGLRRAFRVAGAGTLIASLWPVEDQAAREWMAALYRARFIDGLDAAESARRASLEVLRARRERKESDAPFYWAGFVASGDWR